MRMIKLIERRFYIPSFGGKAINFGYNPWLRERVKHRVHYVVKAAMIRNRFILRNAVCRSGVVAAAKGFYEERRSTS